MTYYPNNPAAGQTLGNSRPQVQGNFSIIFSSFALNHIDFNTLGTGKHKFVTYFTQTADPSIASPDINIYSKTVDAASQLFFQQGVGGAIYQLTGTAKTASSIPSAIGNGYSYLPGGILIQWGSAGATADSTPVPFNKTFSANLFSLVISHSSTAPAEGTQAIVSAASKTTSGFTLRVNGASSASYSYVAIGN